MREIECRVEAVDFLIIFSVLYESRLNFYSANTLNLISTAGNRISDFGVVDSIRLFACKQIWFIFI
jgi:hypothetical protein